MKRAQALHEARRRWGERAWVRRKMTDPPRFEVGRMSTAPWRTNREVVMGTGGSWQEALHVADEAMSRRGFTLVKARKTTRIGLFEGGDRPPTLAEAIDVMELAAAKGVDEVLWLCGEERRVHVGRCTCGEVVVGAGQCALCEALEVLLESEDPASAADLQARAETAERWLQRVAVVADQLAKQSRG